jgi:hypothetical protein
MGYQTYKQCVDTCMQHLEKNLCYYLSSAHFEFETNIIETPSSQEDTTIQFTERAHIALKYHITASFPYLTPCIYSIQEIVYHCILAQLLLAHANVAHDNITQICPCFMSLLPKFAVKCIDPLIIRKLYSEYQTIWKSAGTIQRKWRRVITDPTHPICQRRLMREYHGLCNAY